MERIIKSLGLASCMVICSIGNSIAQENPLLRPSNLPLGALEFDKVQIEHYLPAFEEGMKKHQEEIEAIINNPAPPTFENTIVAMQRAGQLLSRVELQFSALMGSLGTKDLRQIQKIVNPKLTAHYDLIGLNQKLFDRIQTVYKTQLRRLKGEDARLLRLIYQEFVHSGASLSPEKKEELKRLNTQLANLTNRFRSTIVDAQASATVIVDDPAELEGLSKREIEQAAQDAQDAGFEGKYLLTNSNFTRSSYLSTLKNRDLRRRLMEASLNRAEKGDKNDTQQLVLEIVKLRAKKARLMGYKDYASWAQENQMATKPENVYRLMKSIAEPLKEKIRHDAEELQAFAHKIDGDTLRLQTWDWDYYAELLRKEKYDINEQELKVYFPLDNVVTNGIFYLAKELYGISFIPRTDLPVYHPDVKVYEVRDSLNKPFALYYTDFYRRPGKRGGAWMGNFRQQSHLLGNTPIIYNVCNFAPPVNGQPSLLSWDNVSTLFHEFGHTLHGLFADGKYEYTSGTKVPRDFVEMPSQINEHWATDPKIFARYAKHYQTGAPMPEELVEKMKKAETFNLGYPLAERVTAVLLDMAWHSISEDTSIPNIGQFEQETLTHFGVYNPLTPPRYRTTYFLHSIGGAYAAGYYSYIWSEVLDQNIYSWFMRHGGLNRANGNRFRELILSKGNSKDLNIQFQKLTGLKHPDIGDLMRSKGLK